MRALRIGLACAAASLALACSETREQKFEKALRVVETTQADVEKAEERVAEQERRYEKARAQADRAQDELRTARDHLAAAREALAEARAEVSKWADDATLFRTVQTRLLEASALRDAAVSARVEQGVAILEGSVPTSEARDRAVAIARETPGIVGVESRLAVEPREQPGARPTPSMVPAQEEPSISAVPSPEPVAPEPPAPEPGAPEAVAPQTTLPPVISPEEQAPEEQAERSDAEPEPEPSPSAPGGRRL